MSSKKIKTIGVLTSGGDAPGMNAAIRAVTRTALFYDRKVVGIFRGYDGLIQGDFEELSSKSVKHILNKGGTFLKSARSQEFRTEEGRAKAAEQLYKNGIDALVVIGGDGSFTGAMHLSEEHEIPIIGVPGTIDNNLYGTDYTIGYDTATNTVVDAIDKIRDTASSHNRLFFVEVMGRDTGFIALQTAVATGALSVILPERTTTWEALLADIKAGEAARKTSNIVIVAEGNHLGDPYSLKKRVEEELPQIEAKVTILGHLQRGGAPSCFDRVIASRLGVEAVEALLNGKSNIMVGLLNDELSHTFFLQAIKNQAQIDQDLIRISKILNTQ
ncbi:MAG: 6-phosphofructokinase [Flavobacteriales bacterium]|nr:6-phosphofructokinase [Flavobacteriales bacterium]